MVLGVVLYVEVFFSYARYALPLWVMAFARAAGPLWGWLVRYRSRTGLLLLGGATWLTALMMADCGRPRTCSGTCRRGSEPDSLVRPAQVAGDAATGNCRPEHVAGPHELCPARGQVAEPGDRHLHGRPLRPAHSAQASRPGCTVRWVVAVRDVDSAGELFDAEVSYEEIRDSDKPAGSHEHARSRLFRIVRRTANHTVARAD